MAIDAVTVYEPAASATTREIAVDTVAAREYQVVKLAWGASGTATLVEATAPLPVTLVAADLAALETISAAQSGTWNVGTVTAVTAITNALPAGTNAIGKLAANSGVDIGDVDVTSFPALSSATDSIAAVQSGTWNVTNVSGTVSLPTGAATAALQGAGLPVALSSDRLKVESAGKVAHDAPYTENPVPVGGYASSAIPTVVSADGDVTRLWLTRAGATVLGGSSEYNADAQGLVTVLVNRPSGSAGGGLLGVAPAVFNGSSSDRLRGPSGDGMAATGFLGAVGMDWNLTTFDRRRGNTEGTLLTSAARTTDVATASQTNHNARGVVIYVRVTSAGTGSITPLVKMVDVQTGATPNLWTAAAAITATGDFIYVIYPGASYSGAGTQLSSSLALPRTWQLYMLHNNANSITYSASYAYVL